MKKSILLLCLLAATPLYTMEAPQEAKVRIMSFNIRRAGNEKNEQNLWAQRRNRVEALIKQVNPDFLGLQEPVKEQIDDLERSLGHYAWFGTGRGTCWFGMGGDEYNPIFYRTDRFELLAHGTFSINPCTRLEYAWNPKKYGLLPRICTWGKFQDKVTGKQFYIYNTHLDHKYQDAQLHGLMNIMNFIESQATDLPIILMGDFNTELTPELQSTTLKNFTDTKQITQQLAGPAFTRTGWRFEELKKIDHILINANAPATILKHTVIQEQSKDLLPSDHRPVVVDLVLR